MRWRQEHTLHISLVRVEFRRSPVRRQLAQVCWKGLVCWGSGMAAESGWHRTSPPAVPMSKPGTQPSSTLDIIARHVAAITPATARPCSKVLLPPSSHHLSCAQSTLIPPSGFLNMLSMDGGGARKTNAGSSMLREEPGSVLCTVCSFG